ncbi:MAG TPA: hypothetical protein VFX98_14455 [Longimicrobiaceae bacterium]|nr:hypothetical protein [Longimicrobiaceae bacterium]
MHAVQLTPWVAVLLLAVVVVGVVVSAGYGLIGLPILFLVAALLGGALMSFLHDD